MMILTNSVSASHLPLRSEQLASTEELIEEAAGRSFMSLARNDRESFEPGQTRIGLETAWRGKIMISTGARF
ncbi:hypothetical protein DPM13_09195 [Paracoccus mutanolyticus]|uniref:Uncharacterized protein n=1 Tax=Paracoccus mutanolyticus TaxID=1499308 RepID=A0ABN5M5U4_9RHOB|nr:hypothetical protein [Paracoccus mutanolyticus]AWX93239.1 hypothetical protein DPM13_09195 [Paracoccus mutanolyticus]